MKADLSSGGNYYIALAINPNVLMSKSNNSYRIKSFPVLRNNGIDRGVIFFAKNIKPQIAATRIN